MHKGTFRKKSYAGVVMYDLVIVMTVYCIAVGGELRDDIPRLPLFALRKSANFHQSVDEAIQLLENKLKSDEGTDKRCASDGELYIDTFFECHCSSTEN